MHISSTVLYMADYIVLKSHTCDYLKATNDTASLKKLMKIFRYQGDLISFNDGGLLGDLLLNIYPPEMVVNCTNVSARKCNYLDLYKLVIPW